MGANVSGDASNAAADPREHIGSCGKKAAARFIGAAAGQQQQQPARWGASSTPCSSLAYTSADKRAALGQRRIFKPGDPELVLRVDGLNGFNAMMATMKEMGYESEEEEGDEEQAGKNGASAVAAGAADDEVGAAIDPNPKPSKAAAGEAAGIGAGAAAKPPGGDLEAGAGGAQPDHSSSVEPTMSTRQQSLVVCAFASIMLVLVGAVVLVLYLQPGST